MAFGASRLSPLVVLVAALAAAGCGRGPASIPVETLFTRMPSSFTGIAFVNRLTDSEALNVFTYRNYYNGGGVGLGDFNNDGLTDVFLTANQLPDRLYLNRGGFRFDDVTDAAGVAGTQRWTTGVAVADVNGDGWLDLYVCNAGPYDPPARANALFINQGAGADGVPRFEEQAAAYGLADTGYSTHAAFFDYDRDGDLDAYVLNNSPQPVSSFGLRNIRHIRNPHGGHRLYRNEGNRFVDVSQAAGIYGSEIAFGLGVTAGDIDRDGWVDLYISNDFFERDYLYLNNGDGTFREALEAQIRTLSLSSMGADLADVTNDGYPELYVTDMLPESDRRLKTTSAYEAWQVYREKLENGYYHQFMRNTLQLNHGNGTFSEVGQLAGVAATDWSWGALMADFDNDGRKDLFVCNGVFRDVIDQDFITYLATQVDLRALQKGEGASYEELTERIPSIRLANYLFAQEGPLAFTNRAAAWGLGDASFSNGAAYGDLDNDGDLDLVVNNLNEEAFVYRNETDTLRAHHYLQVRFDGEGANRFGVGASVSVFQGDDVYYAEQIPTRGFQSSVAPVLTLGLGAHQRVEGVVVAWPDGRQEVRTNVRTDQLLTFAQRDAAAAGGAPRPAAPGPPLFAAADLPPGLDFVHRENDFVDFNRDVLVPKLVSTEGPRLAVGDVNGDGRADVFVGGAREQSAALFVQRTDGFVRANAPLFAADSLSEDVAALFFDADGDRDLDLYVVTGGNEFAPTAPALEDRLYLGDGRGGFRKAEGHLPSFPQSGSCVAAADYDRDGDLDLFVGGRLEPWRYGVDAPSVLLQNDGRGRFTDVTAQAAPALAQAGMVTDALWSDVDRDGQADLVVVGEWMPITVFRNTGGRLDRLDVPGLARSHGLWNRIVADDLDGDGDPDFVVGNAGRNLPWRPSAAHPVTMHVLDFNGDGKVEQIISSPNGGRTFPTLLRDELLAQLPSLRERFPDHASYAEKTVEEIFSPEERSRAVVRELYTLETAVVENAGGGAFALHALPVEAQVSPVYGLVPGDFDGDGTKDLLLAGNFYGFRPDVGRLDASYGAFLRGLGGLSFRSVPARASGLQLHGAVRDARLLDTARGEQLLLLSRNDAPLQVVRLVPPRK